MKPEIIRQLSFRPPLPEVYGAKDYRDKRALYEYMDDLIDRAGLDDHFIRLVLEHRQLDPTKVGTKFLNHCITAFRTNIVRFVENHLPVRELSIQLADSHLFQWFCKVANFGPVLAPSKSTLDRYGRFLPEDKINDLGTRLLRLAGQPVTNGEGQALGLEQSLDLTNVWLDSFCLKANIHYPTDWVLLIDATRTLMKATILIRDAGLKNRMPQSPEEFLRDMNKLGIAMGQQRRQKDSKRNRKRILRLMKKAIKKTQKHAQMHRDLLEERWQETEWTWPQAQQIIERIDEILAQLPTAEKQAHDRIIGGRQVKSSEKILSLYETEIQVIVRGKLGTEVEFGNQLMLVEQRDGLLMHHRLYEEVVSDSKCLIPVVESIQERFAIEIEGVCGDRGFGSKANDKWLGEDGNYVCPRKIEDLREKMKNGEFADRQRRRSQTEGRISIFVHRFLGDLLRVKGLTNRETAVNWAALSHNMWKLANMRKQQADERARQELAQAA
jgi:hypothetical protein